ncbi:MAG: hypothetical protein Q7R81_06750 [Candidatus Peregrinibacteria bacterium]|nr:hypothetical protein [Candidatus Peregrinibacteria bacterium]
MTDPTPTPQAPGLPPPPRIPTGRELFDAIMGYIEPELTSEAVKTLDAKYANEAQTDFETRKKRYLLAFERYDQAYMGYVETLQAQVERYRKEVFKKAEVQERSHEEGLMDQMLGAMLSQPT